MKSRASTRDSMTYGSMSSLIVMPVGLTTTGDGQKPRKPIRG